MHQPNSNKLTVSIFGKCNSGKSSLFNSILGSELAVVSDVAGTTTDPVIKSMELLPFGPIVLIDTAGLSDETSIGDLRIEKTKKILNRTDFAIYVISQDILDDDFIFFEKEFIKRNIPFLIVETKSDLNKENNSKNLKCSVKNYESILNLKNVIAHELLKLKDNEKPLLENLVSEKNTVVLVTPIDSGAPKGRLILPQVQTIRECLDKNARCYVTNLENLNDTLSDSQKIDLVITDSQLFKEVSEIVSEEIKLTSFSILMARQKGSIDDFLSGVNAIKNLSDGDKVLISETCTHTTNHEDIGQVKIPAALKRLTGKKLNFDFKYGRDYPDNLEEYSLIIHCGGCMITRKEMMNRILIAKEKNVPITNYGIFLAYANVTLERSINLF